MMSSLALPRQLIMLALCLLLSACHVGSPIQPGPRAVNLAQQLTPSPLREQLLSCATHGFERTDFSIAHRGAPLFYPEHTREGYRAAATMGAGLVECDVTFTRDGELVCRHSQCDLHSTTNILATPLAARCSEPFQPATSSEPATARCCTSDLTLAEYQSLCGRRDHVDPNATSLGDYLATPDSPIDGEPVACGTLVTHSESINLFNELGVKYVPELKRPMVEMPFADPLLAEPLTQDNYARALLDAYKSKGINPLNVFPQSFNLQDVLLWINEYPEFAANVVYLDPRGRDPSFRASLADMQALYDQGLRHLAPPIPMLITLNDAGELAATDYARFARQAGLKLITWTFESGRADAPDNWLYMSIPGFIHHEARMLEVLDFLATEVGVVGIFSDWPGTVTYYANCMEAGRLKTR